MRFTACGNDTAQSFRNDLKGLNALFLVQLFFFYTLICSVFIVASSFRRPNWQAIMIYSCEQQYLPHTSLQYGELPQIQRTDASDHIYASRMPVVNCKS